MTRGTQPSSIPWHQRLEARVLATVTLIAGLCLAGVIYSTGRIVRSYSLSRSREDLEAARVAFDRLVDARARFAAAQTRLIAELPVFRATLDPASNIGADAATISAMAEDYRGKLSAQFCIVTDAGGRWIGAPGWPAAEPQQRVGPAIASAARGQAGRQIVSMADGLFLVVSEPAVFGDEVLGTITAGYRLDDTVASELSLATHCDVTLVCAGRRLCGSSLPAAPRQALAALVAGGSSELGGWNAPPVLRQLDRAAFVSGIYPLGTSAGGRGGELVLLRAWEPTQRALDEMQRWFLLVGAVTLVAALAGSFAASRRLTRPLRRLADAADRIARDEWAGHVSDDRGPIETRTVATAFNEMTVRLGHWHAEATARAARLEEAYERFRVVTESANDAIVSVDEGARIVFWNRRAQAVFGYSEEEALGGPLSAIVAGTEGEVRRYLLGDDEWLGRTVELTGRRRDGSAVPLELSLSRWRAEAAVFYTAVIRDITERRQAQAALRDREEQLRQAQKMEAVGRLAGGIAHDFNNLLTAILGYADFLVDDVPAASRGDVEGIRKAGRSAAALTRQLLAFSRRQILQPEVLNLNAVVTNTQKLLRRLIGEDVEMVMALDPRIPAIEADPGQIEQILLNLAVNARDAMPDGGRLTIATARRDAPANEEAPAAVQSAPLVDVIVSDTGCGMTEEVRAHIFEPFFTTKAPGKGTGLGLATVYGIVQQSGARIEVESAPGQGTRFRISFPGLLRAAGETETAAADQTPRIARGQETVLLVEDNESVRDLARDALVRGGYRVLEAVNGEAALGLAMEHAGGVDLVMTDVVMPVMGGRELAARVTSMWPGLRILFTSGYTDDTLLRDAAMEPGAAFLQKPFTPDVLLRTIRSILDQPAGSGAGRAGAHADQ